MVPSSCLQVMMLKKAQEQQPGKGWQPRLQTEKLKSCHWGDLNLRPWKDSERSNQRIWVVSGRARRALAGGRAERSSSANKDDRDKQLMLKYFPHFHTAICRSGPEQWPWGRGSEVVGGGRGRGREASFVLSGKQDGSGPEDAAGGMCVRGPRGAPGPGTSEEDGRHGSTLQGCWQSMPPAPASRIAPTPHTQRAPALSRCMSAPPCFVLVPACCDALGVRKVSLGAEEGGPGTQAGGCSFLGVQESPGEALTDAAGPCLRGCSPWLQALGRGGKDPAWPTAALMPSSLAHRILWSRGSAHLEKPRLYGGRLSPEVHHYHHQHHFL